jgi:dihydroflavonol-4-reductase
VALAAVEAGHDVVAVARPGPAGRDGVRVGTHLVERRTADLTDPEGLAAALRGCEALVHCAAVYAFGAQRAREVDSVNADGTRAVLEAAARAGVGRAVVTTSSVTCGSSLAPRPRTEADRLGAEPAPAYYASKVAQEQAALEVSRLRGIPVVLALPTVVLGGPYQRLAPSNAIVLRYLLDPTRSTFPGGCNVVDARDVGTGHVLLLEHGVPGERYLLGGEDVTWRALHSLVSALAGLPGPFAELSSGSAWAAAAASEGWARLTSTQPLSTRDEATTVGRHYWYSSTRAEELGYAARPARAALAAALAWLAVGRDLPRWAREGLRLSEEVRAARDPVPRPLEPQAAEPHPAGLPRAELHPAETSAADEVDALSRRPRRSPPAWPRRPR